MNAPSPTDAALCIRCGYTLAGLPITNNCPECATPIERSLKGDNLRYSDPDYVTTLARGITLIVLSLWLFVAFAIASVAIAYFTYSGKELLLAAASLVISANFLLGWWWLTRPDVGQLTTNKGEKPRQYVRIALAVLVVTKIALVVLPLTATLPAELLRAIKSIDRITLLLCLLAGTFYLRWLAQRIPSEDLRAKSVTLAKLLLGCLAIYVVMIALKSAKLVAPRSFIDSVLSWVMIASFVYTLFLLNGVRKWLKQIMVRQAKR